MHVYKYIIGYIHIHVATFISINDIMNLHGFHAKHTLLFSWCLIVADFDLTSKFTCTADQKNRTCKILAPRKYTVLQYM